MSTKNVALTQEDVGNERRPPMSSSKLEGMFQEFPWLEDYVRYDFVRRVYVSRITPEIYYRYVGFWGHQSSHYEKMYCLDDKGELVVFQREVVKLRPWWWPGTEEKVRKIVSIKGVISVGSSLETGLNFLQDEASRVRFVVSWFPPTGTVIIYKPPKDYTIQLWVQAQIDTERQKTKSEIAAIDDEPNNLK